MNNYVVIATDKITKEDMVLQENLTEDKAEKFCEMWGWNYCDENGKSFYLSYKKREVRL